VLHQLGPDTRLRFRLWITIMAIAATKPPAAAESLEFRALRSISDLEKAASDGLTFAH